MLIQGYHLSLIVLSCVVLFGLPQQVLLWINTDGYPGECTMVPAGS